MINNILEDILKEDTNKEIKEKIVQIADLMVKKGYFEFKKFHR